MNRLRNFYFPKHSNWVFIFLLGAMAVTYNYHEILFKGPQSNHMWRQADCLSLTSHYHEKNNPFLQPSIHNLCNDGKGKTVSDFPLIYFTVAQMWKVFGQHEFIYRGLVLVLWITGLFTLFKLSEEWLKDSTLGLFISLLLFTSPTLIFYGNNFLMNVPAFSLALIGLYFFFQFYKNQQFRFLLISVGFYTVAGLLKVPSIMSFIAIVGLFVLEISGLKLTRARKIFDHPWKTALVFLLPLVILSSWFIHAHHYNANNCSGVFLVGILPVWALDNGQISTYVDAIRDHMKWDYLRLETQVLILAIFTLNLVFWKKADRVILLLTLILSVGFVFFCLLFFQALKDHDYYAINLFVLIPFVLLTGFSQFKNLWKRGYRSWLFRLLLMAFLIHNVDFARRRMDSRYSMKNPSNEKYRDHYESLTRIRPFLDDIGVKQSDTIVFLSDPSINISLYLLNQKGWTNYNIASNPKRIEIAKKMGAKYIFLIDEELEQFEGFRGFLGKKVGQFETIHVYTI